MVSLFTVPISVSGPFWIHVAEKEKRKFVSKQTDLEFPEFLFLTIPSISRYPYGMQNVCQDHVVSLKFMNSRVNKY